MAITAVRKRNRGIEMDNKFQWGRVDEILMFIAALGFLLLLAGMNMPAEAIMTMGGTLMTVVPVYIKAALERKNGNGNGDTPPTSIVREIHHTTSTVKPPKHHLRESE